MYQLDRIDLQILQLLSKNARSTNKYIASKIGIAPSTCFERTRIMQEKGIIKGYHAEINMGLLGLSLKAMISIKLKTHSRHQLDSFFQYVNDLPPVITIFYLSGATDLLLQVEVIDSKHLHQFILDAFSSREEVSQIETSIIYEKKRKYSCDALIIDD